MKIEKGKLYLFNGHLKKADEDKEVNSISYSNKIAVYCPVLEDRKFISEKLNLKFDDYDSISREVFYLDEDVTSSYDDYKYYYKQEHKLITIDQFKKFYPEVETSDTSIKSEENVQNNVHPNHYTNKGIQPIDYIEANKLDFNEGNVIKYVTRYKDKNGLEDLKKAKFYLERLISNYESK